MKSIKFTKLVGAGNDFIVIDAQKGIDYKKLTMKVCDRTEGIGADGLLILEKSKTSDYKMRIINADGSEAEMCGNGARCMAAYIVKTRKPIKKLFSIETLAGEILANVETGLKPVSTEYVATMRLSDPKDYSPEIRIIVNDRPLHVSYIDTGVPHTIVFVDGLEKIDAAGIGPKIRYHDRFAPRGTNVNFVEQFKEDLVGVRTYERGVEDETKACGTGSVAAALVSYRKANPKITNKTKAVMNVLTASGETLKVTFDLIDGKITNVWLKGSAKFIAIGEYFWK